MDLLGLMKTCPEKLCLRNVLAIAAGVVLAAFVAVWFCSRKQGTVQNVTEIQKDGDCARSNQLTSRSAASDIRGRFSSMPKLSGAHRDGDWAYEISYEPHPSKYEPYGIRIMFKGREITGEPGDAVSTPWGILRCAKDKRWFAPRWYFGCVPADFKGTRDLTPVDRNAIRPAVHPNEDEILADCITVLRTHRQNECVEAFGILRKMGANAAPAVPELIDLLGKEYELSLEGSGGSLNTVYAIECIGFIGKAAKDALPTLLRYAEHPDANLRSSLVWALFRISPYSKDTRTYILRSLKDESDRVRVAAESATRELMRMSPRTPGHHDAAEATNEIETADP